MENRKLALEALSAITGCEIRVTKQSHQRSQGASAEPDLLSPQEFINRVMFLDIDEMQSVVTATTISGGKTSFEEQSSDQWGGKGSMAGYKQQSAKFHASGSPGETKAASTPKMMFIHEEEFFDPRFDYDFTNIKDRDEKFKRGNEPYKRPCGWNRFALRVLNKYNDGDEWLGTGPDAWPVSYHGTSKEASANIIHGHYEPGPRQVYGRGIYSTPEITEASRYAKTFKSKKTNKTYKVVLQNRINPQKRQITRRSDYWLVPVPKGTPAAAEKEIVESAIRPYGLLLKEV